MLLSAAAITGVVIEVQHHRRESAAPASASASASAAPSFSPPALTSASRAQIEQAIAELERWVKPGASDARSPWALAHGLIAFGPELRASDAKPAIDVIGSFAEKTETGYAFPREKAGQLVEPHPDLLIKTLLEIGVSPERELVAAGGERITLARLIDDARERAKPPESDRDWQHAAWTLSALSLDQRHPVATELASAALARLERDHAIIARHGGPAADAFDPGTPLQRAKADKTGIYGQGCGGLHLISAVTLAVMRTKQPAQISRLRKQLGVLAYRYEIERAAYAKLVARQPEHGLLLRVQQLKFFGHLVEALMLARKLGAYRPDTEGGKKLDGIVSTASADVARVVGELDRGGVPLRLDRIRAEREQTYLDLIGDGCHAIHGLRSALALHPGR